MLSAIVPPSPSNETGRRDLSRESLSAICCRRRLVAPPAGQKKAREMWFLARLYNAQQALEMGLVNTVVPLEKLEEETLVW